MKEIIDKILITVKQNSSFKFRLGFLLLLINVPIGWIIGPLVGILFGWLFSAKVGGAVALTFYIVSWGMLGLGVLLAGKDGYRISKQLIQDVRKKISLKKKKVPAATVETE